MFPKLIEMHKMKIIHLFGDYTKPKMLSEVDGHSYLIRQIHYEKRKDLLLTAPWAKCLMTGKGRWRITAGPPQESGETGAELMLKRTHIHQGKQQRAGCWPPNWLHGICRDDSGCAKS